MMNKRAPRRSDEEWHQIILAARASGLSDFEYCRDNSIPTSTFYRVIILLRRRRQSGILSSNCPAGTAVP